MNMKTSRPTRILPRTVCRLCLWPAEPSIAIFGSEGARLNISEKINEVFPFEVKMGDCLPDIICPLCCYKLDIFHDFYKSAGRAHNKLRKYFIFPVTELEHENQVIDSLPENNLNIKMNEKAIHQPYPPAYSDVKGNFSNSSDQVKIRRTRRRRRRTRRSPQCHAIEEINVMFEENAKNSSKPIALPRNSQCNASARRKLSSAPVLSTSNINSDIPENTEQNMTRRENEEYIYEQFCEKYEANIQCLIHYCKTPALLPKKRHFCDEKFSDSSTSTLHPSKKNHLTSASLDGIKCSDIFLSFKALGNHSKSECLIKEPSPRSSPRTLETHFYACTICNQEFSSLSEMKRHRTTMEHQANIKKHFLNLEEYYASELPRRNISSLMWVSEGKMP